MQRIFNSDKIQDNSLTSDRTVSYVDHISLSSHTSVTVQNFKKWSGFYGPPSIWTLNKAVTYRAVFCIDVSVWNLHKQIHVTSPCSQIICRRAELTHTALYKSHHQSVRQNIHVCHNAEPFISVSSLCNNKFYKFIFIYNTAHYRAQTPGNKIKLTNWSNN